MDSMCVYDECLFICDAWVYTSNVNLMYIYTKPLFYMHVFLGLHALTMGDSEGTDKIEKNMYKCIIRTSSTRFTNRARYNYQ